MQHRLDCYYKLQEEIKKDSSFINNGFSFFAKGGYGTVREKKLGSCAIISKELPGVEKNKREIDTHTKLSNLVLQKKTPHFPLLYHVKTDANTTIYMEPLAATLEHWLRTSHSLEEWESMMFQVWAAIYTMQNKVKVYHNDLTVVNVMLIEVAPGGNWKYNIDGKEYTVLNKGHQFIVIDFGSSGESNRLGVTKWFYKNKDLDYFLTIYNRLQVMALSEQCSIQQAEDLLRKHGENKYIHKSRSKIRFKNNDNSDRNTFLKRRYKRSLLFRIIEIGKFNQLYDPSGSGIKMPNKETTQWLRSLKKMVGKPLVEVLRTCYPNYSTDVAPIQLFNLD